MKTFGYFIFWKNPAYRSKARNKRMPRQKHIFKTSKSLLHLLFSVSFPVQNLFISDDIKPEENEK